MNEKWNTIVSLLTTKQKTISTMESCTGGGVANAITNIPGASEVLQYSAVTYSNDYKIKMGVSSSIIEEYTVYSMETAKAMSKAISDFTASSYGIGITGKLKRSDSRNDAGNDDQVFYSIYDRDTDFYHTFQVTLTKEERWENKEDVIEEIAKHLLDILTTK